MTRQLALVVCCLGLMAAYAKAEPPNVLFIAVDDLRVELGCYGSEHVKSPHIDWLASRGTLFEHAYCQQTVCNPSRASLLTGLRPDTLRVWDLPTHFRENHPDAVTLPQLFKRNGYHAQCIGKIFHNWVQDDWKGDPASWSVPSVLHYNSHYNDKPKIKGKLPPNLASGWRGSECRDVPDDAYFDGRVANTAVRTLRDLSKGDQPFFLAVGFWKPHTPFNAPKKYWDLYDRDAIPLPQRLQPPADVPEIALTDARFKQGKNSDQLREMHHGHLAAISYLDAQIGRVLDELEKTGLREKTIVVFWSDHGLHLGEHGLTRKTTAFELDAHVPLIISTPDHRPDQRTNALVELLDLYPTLADLCGLDAPKNLEGRSLKPILEDPEAEVKSVALTQTPRPNYPRGKPPKTMGYSIRTPRYRYTEWRDFTTGNVQARELYDHQTDPAETKNLAVAEDQQAVLTELAVVLENTLANASESAMTYRRFQVQEADGRVVSMKPIRAKATPRWAGEVSQERFDYSQAVREEPFFAAPIPFVIPPTDAGEPFGRHNHQPSIAWLPNGDLLAIWYSTKSEQGTELTVVASRLRANQEQWDPAAEFFKAENRNMHGSSIFHDGKGTIYHFNGMGPEGGRGWAKLALLMRTSRDNGVTWTPPQAIDPRFVGRHQVISGTLLTSDGVLIQNCDAVPTGHGGTALHLSRDGGKTWNDPGAGKPKPNFTQGGTGQGTIAGIHAKVAELKDGRLLAFGRGDTIDGRMPMSLSADLGKTWTYQPSPFPPIGSGQRLVLERLQEGPLLFVSFTSGNRRLPESNGMSFVDQDGNEFTGHGMFAALSFDEGKTWPVRKLLTPGDGQFDGGAHTGKFTATPTRAEHAGYLAVTQSPDGVIHLISSRLHYRFNLPWLTEGTKR